MLHTAVHKSSSRRLLGYDTVCDVAGYQRFRSPSWLHLQGEVNGQIIDGRSVGQSVSQSVHPSVLVSSPFSYS